MKKRMMILLIPALLFQKLVLSQEFSGRTGNDSIRLCQIISIDGVNLKGRLISENQDKLTILDISLGEVTLTKKNIRRIERFAPGSNYGIYLFNDNIIRGKVIGIDSARWVVNTESIGVVEVKTTDIKNFEEEGIDISDIKNGFENLNPGCYFAGPAPFALPRRRLIFHNTEILLNGLSYGLARNFTISAGGVYFYIPYANLKYSAEIIHNFHLSVGAMGFGFPIFSSGNVAPVTGAGYSQLAFGRSDNHIAGGIYYVYNGSFITNGTGFADEPAYSVSGIKRINEHIAIMAEDYIVPYVHRTYQYNPPYTIYSTRYINSGAAGVKLFLQKGLFGSKSCVLNLGMLWIANSDLGSRDRSLVAFPVISMSNLLN